MRIFKKYDAPTTAFFAIAAVSVGFVVYPVWNYTRFYLALWGFDYTISNIAINGNNTIDLNRMTEILVGIEFLVMNPTDYSGLQLTSIACGFEYVDGSHLVWEQTGRGHWGGEWVSSNLWELKTETFGELRFTIGAYASDTVALTLTVSQYIGTELDRNNAGIFIGLLKARPGQIEWQLNCHLTLSSFLGGFDVQRYFSYTTLVSYK